MFLNNLLVCKDNLFEDKKKLPIMPENIIRNKEYDYILYIDFPCCGGGTEFFTKCILMNYKKYNNFLVIRYRESEFLVTINDTHLVCIYTYDKFFHQRFR